MKQEANNNQVGLYVDRVESRVAKDSPSHLKHEKRTLDDIPRFSMLQVEQFLGILRRLGSRTPLLQMIANAFIWCDEALAVGICIVAKVVVGVSKKPENQPIQTENLKFGSVRF